MQLKLSTILLFVVMAGYTTLQAQTKDNKISEKDFVIPPGPVVDNNTAAIILSDIGSISFVGNKNDWWVGYVFEKKTRIKIVNKTSFELATIKINLYGRDDEKDKVENLEATTYNIENGKLTATSLSPTDIFDNVLNKYMSQKKFTFPNIREGSIIEYSYKIKSGFYFNLPEWKFQHSYPCLHSAFEIAAPELMNYLASRTGVDTATVSSSDDGYGQLQVGNFAIGSVLHKRKWVMENVPAFKDEPFIYAPAEYLDGVRLHYESIRVVRKADLIPSWKSITEVLLRSEHFGGAIDAERGLNLANTMEKITAHDDKLLDAAKSIYNYVRDNFTCVKDDDIYIDNDLYEVNKKRKGSVAEMNLLLIALLRLKGLIVDPVILSTRDYGVHPVDYPELDKMNYVIARLKIYGDTIYLDATHPQLGFGKLPTECYNGHARVISDKDSGDVFFFPENIKELKRTTIFIQNDEKNNGLMTGTFQSMPGYHESYDIRTAISNNGIEGYFKKIKGIQDGEVVVENLAVDSLKKPDDPISIHYDFSFKPGNGTADVVYYNPMFAERRKENPFTATERKYPVEMPAPVDEIYVFNMEIPNGYTVEEMPKSAKVAFNGNEGFYEYIIQKDETNVQLRSHLKIDRAIFRPDEYNVLRDFFAYVVKKQAEQIVFRRKK